MISHIKRRWVLWSLRGVTVVCYAIASFAALYLVWMVGPFLETKYLPAVGKMIIQRATVDDQGRTELMVAFRKIRDCEYIGISWYRGDPRGEFERVPIILGRQESDISSPNRPVGYQFTGPWTVAVPFAELHSNSFALLQHRCHPFWLTTTEFWP